MQLYGLKIDLVCNEVVEKCYVYLDFVCNKLKFYNKIFFLPFKYRVRYLWGRVANKGCD